MLEMPGWGNVPCEVLDAVEPVRLVHTFADWAPTWRLVAEGDGTRLFLDHSGFHLDQPDHRFALDAMGPGWRDEVLPQLVALLERT